jgi:hypothetical protein
MVAGRIEPWLTLPLLAGSAAPRILALFMLA